MEINSPDEPPSVAKAVGLLLDRLYFVVDTSGNRVRRTESKKGHYSLEMPFESFRHFDDWIQSTVSGPEIPGLEKTARVGGINVFPEMAEVFFDCVGSNGFQVVLAQFLKARFPFGRKVLGMIKPVPFALVQKPDPLQFKCVMFLFAHFVHRIIQVRFYVEPVKDSLLVGIGDPLAAGSAVRLPHIHGNARNAFAPILTQCDKEPAQRFLAPILPPWRSPGCGQR